MSLLLSQLSMRETKGCGSYYHNLSKIGPPPFFEGSCCKRCFSLKSMSTSLCMRLCYCISKRITKKALQTYYMCTVINKARPTACEVGVFSRAISQLLKIYPSPSLRSHLSSSPMSVFLRDTVLSWTARVRHYQLGLLWTQDELHIAWKRKWL